MVDPTAAGMVSHSVEMMAGAMGGVTAEMSAAPTGLTAAVARAVAKAVSLVCPSVAIPAVQRVW